MFERRVKVVLLIALVALLVVIGRLVDLQIIHADIYREQAADALLLRPQTLPFVRGRILDRTGLILASDEPAWDIKIDYGMLAMEDAYIEACVQRFRKNGRYGAGLDAAAVEAALRAEVVEMWRQLAHFSGESIYTLAARRDEICDRVGRIRAAHVARRGYDEPIEEERWAHAIVAGLDDQQQVAARLHFGKYPWVEIEASNRRMYLPAESLGHVLGQTAAVDAGDVKNDPYGDDRLRRYLANETIGATGVELAAEDLLRGRRGRFQEDRKGNVLEDEPARSGDDVSLTIRYDLQQRLYDLMDSQLPRLPCSPGGAIVVLDVATREVLALVSYPGYDPNLFRTNYDDLRRDTIHMPLQFRAVANRYAPGSLVKPLTCLAGLSSGVIDLNTRLECTGYLFPDNPGAAGSKCWEVPGTGRRKAHGMINVTEALEGSCNIFMYRIGIAVGVDYLCSFFDMVGFGQPSGTDLREEVWGINPTPSWLNDKAGRSVQRADARFFAIGQGEVSVTPVQAADLMASYAAGASRKVCLIRGRGDNPQWELPGTAADWAAIHKGLYAVVNSPAGTAYKYARFVDDRYALCGKTGSATANPWPISYKVPYKDRDGNKAVTIMPAGSKYQAKGDFEMLHPGATCDVAGMTVLARYPDIPPLSGDKHAHAWFAGYLQRIDSAGQPMYQIPPRIAFAVLVEFGGSGGRASGPVAQQVARIILDTLGDDLDADAPAQVAEPSP